MTFAQSTSKPANPRALGLRPARRPGQDWRVSQGRAARRRREHSGAHVRRRQLGYVATFSLTIPQKTNSSLWPELKDDAPFDTLDLLRDPAIAAQHLELQYVLSIPSPLPCSYFRPARAAKAFTRQASSASRGPRPPMSPRRPRLRASGPKCKKLRTPSTATHIRR